MKRALILSISLFAILTGCSHKEEAKPTPEGLVGTWQLTHRQCYCVPAPTPNEAVTFTDTDVTFYKNGQVTFNGTYASTMVTSFCGGSGPAAGLRFSSSAATREAVLTLAGDSLVLNYGGPCDAPVDTYQRQP